MWSNIRSLSATIFSLSATFIGLLVLAGCNTQPRATSAESMDLIKQVYTACNTKNLERLDAAEVKLKLLVEQQLISTPEQEEFEAIVAIARERKWEESQRRALAFAEAQVR